MEIKKGSKVSIDYEGRFEDGNVFDSSKHGEHSHPLEFTVGEGMVIPGFDKAVLGMKEGEEKEFTLEKDEAYGDYKEEMKKEVPKEALPKEQEPKEGMVLVMSTPEGHQIPAKIAEVKDKSIVIDLNHPLAGKKLIFKIKVVKINDK